MLDESFFDPNIGNRVQHRGSGSNDGHQTKGRGHEQPGKNHAPAESESLFGGAADTQPGPPAKDFILQSFPGKLLLNQILDAAIGLRYHFDAHLSFPYS